MKSEKLTFQQKKEKKKKKRKQKDMKKEEKNENDFDPLNSQRAKTIERLPAKED